MAIAEGGVPPRVNCSIELAVESLSGVTIGLIVTGEKRVSEGGTELDSGGDFVETEARKG